MFLENARGERRVDAYPDVLGLRSGVSVFEGERQVAALSVLGGANRMWIDEGLTEASREVLLSALYGLLLADWLNDDWRGY